MIMYSVDEWKIKKNNKQFKINVGKMKYTGNNGIYDWHYNVKAYKKIGKKYEELKKDFWYDTFEDAMKKVDELLLSNDINDILGTEIIKGFKLKIG